MKRLFSIGLSALLLTACTFSISMERTATPITSVKTPTFPATAPNVIIFDATSTPPTPSSPRFSNIYFTTDSASDHGQLVFAARTRRVYAIWDYENMRAGMTIRRDWYRDETLWITRSETWDFNKYGTNGTVRDIAIYDPENGLPSGEYRLELYIDMQPQPLNAAEWPTFAIVANDQPQQEILSPDGIWAASANDPTALMLRDTRTNTSRQLISGKEIVNLTWLSDSQHLLFTDLDRAMQHTPPNPPFFIHASIWIVDIVTTESFQLYATDNGLPGPLIISPDDHYLAGIEGSGYGDACGMDAAVVIIALAEDFKSSQVYKQKDFSGLPVISDGVVYPTGPGIWQSATQVGFPLAVTCTTDATLSGDYNFDLTTMNAKKVGD